MTGIEGRSLQRLIQDVSSNDISPDMPAITVGEARFVLIQALQQGIAPEDVMQALTEAGYDPNLVLDGERIGGTAFELAHDARAEIRQTENNLRALGFDPGTRDGQVSPRFSQAVREFQQSRGLPTTGLLDIGTARAIGTEAAQAQTQLWRAGYELGSHGIDANIGPDTREALLQFQRDQRLPLSGRVDDATRAALTRRQGEVGYSREDTLAWAQIRLQTLGQQAQDALRGTPLEGQSMTSLAGDDASLQRALQTLRSSSGDRDALGAARFALREYADLARAIREAGHPATADAAHQTLDSARAFFDESSMATWQRRALPER